MPEPAALTPDTADALKHPALVLQPQLQTLTGYTRPAEIEAELQRQGIPYRRGRRGIWTTVQALNQALGVASADPLPTRIDF